MKTTITIEDQDKGAVLAALRIRIIQLQAFRKELETKGERIAADSVMRDIESLTIVLDDLNK